ncbi:MAG: glycosyltransferase family 2 protein [Gemmataceae bacterium]|nr:glycosyltransferase family 2 protein [Gemmataceae bacterium]MDW8266330.1 glycosyltransferase family 2 protein [Gemmataceae bacterium]
MSQFRSGVTTTRPVPSRRLPRRRRPLGSAWQQSFLEAGPPDVSVCIANWNCRDLLRTCLESLHDQPQGVRLETIVVDNGSTDGAADMVAREFPEVILLRQPVNRGFAWACNRAAERAHGRYLLFLNNDTVVPPGTLWQLVEFLETHPGVGLVGPQLRGTDGTPQVSYRHRPSLAVLLHRTALFRWLGLFRRPYRRYRRAFDPHTVRAVDVLMGAALLMPQHVFYEAGGWDEDFTFGGEDIDLSLRIGERYAVVYHPGVAVIHHGRVSSRANVGYSTMHIAAGFARCLRKSGCAGPGVWLYKLAVTLDAPLQLLEKGLQYLWRRCRGQAARAEKSRLAVRGLAHFLRRGLAELWRV